MFPYANCINVRIFPVYVCSFPTSSVFTHNLGHMRFCLNVWFPNHISSVLLLYYTCIKPSTSMYDPCQITAMAYETWACKFCPYLP